MKKGIPLPFLGFLILGTMLIGMASLFIGLFQAYLGNDGDACFSFLFGISCLLSGIATTPHFYKRYVEWRKNNLSTNPEREVGVWKEKTIMPRLL